MTQTEKLQKIVELLGKALHWEFTDEHTILEAQSLARSLLSEPAVPEKEEVKIEKLDKLLPTEAEVRWSEDHRAAILVGAGELMRRKINELVDHLNSRLK